VPREDARKDRDFFVNSKKSNLIFFRHIIPFILKSSSDFYVRRNLQFLKSRLTFWHYVLCLTTKISARQVESYANFGSPKHNSFISQKCYIKFPSLKLSSKLKERADLKLIPVAWRFLQNNMYQIPFSYLKQCLYFNVSFMALSIPF